MGGRSDVVHPGGPKGSSPTWGEARGVATLGAPALRRSHSPVTYIPVHCPHPLSLLSHSPAMA